MNLSEEVVKVKRSKPIPRHTLIKDRFNITLNLEAKVPENSYIATASATEILESPTSYFMAVEKDILNYLEGRIRENQLVSKVKEKLKRGRIRGKFPRNIHQKYYIPGSSIKGAIRSRLEYKLKPYQVNGVLYSYSCYIAQNPRLQERFAVNHIAYWGKDVAIIRERCRGPEVCITCDLMGSSQLASRIHFSDAMMTEGKVIQLSDLNVEAATPNSKFTLSMTGINMNLTELGLLFHAMELYSKNPILIGLFKYRFNDKIGKTPYNGKFTFGKLKLKLKNFKEHISNQLKQMTIDTLLKEAKAALTRSEFSRHMNLEVK